MQIAWSISGRAPGSLNRGTTTGHCTNMVSLRAHFYWIGTGGKLVWPRHPFQFHPRLILIFARGGGDAGSITRPATSDGWERERAREIYRERTNQASRRMTEGLRFKRRYTHRETDPLPSFDAVLIGPRRANFMPNAQRFASHARIEVRDMQIRFGLYATQPPLSLSLGSPESRKQTHQKSSAQKNCPVVFHQLDKLI